MRWHSTPAGTPVDGDLGDDGLQFVAGEAVIDSAGICAVGQASMSDGSLNVSPDPKDNCQPLDDPLEDWQPPTFNWRGNFFSMPHAVIRGAK